MRHQAFQEEGLILRLQGTLPGPSPWFSHDREPRRRPRSHARRPGREHERGIVLRGFLSLPLLITSPGLHIGNAGPDRIGHIMALSSISITGQRRSEGGGSNHHRASSSSRTTRTSLPSASTANCATCARRSATATRSNPSRSIPKTASASCATPPRMSWPRRSRSCSRT